MSKIESFIYDALAWAPYILFLISLIAGVLGKWNKKKGKDSKSYFKVSSLSFIIGLIILLLPLLAFIIGYGPEMLE